MKAAKVELLRVGIATLICVELEKILGPSVLPKPPKPVRVKAEPKPSRAITRIPEIERNIALGLQLLELRAKIKSHREFGRARRRLLDIDTQRAGHLMAVVRAFGTKPEVYRRLSWKALCDMSSPSFPVAARDALERRIIAGERIRAPEIRAARGALKAGKRGSHHAKGSVLDSVSLIKLLAPSSDDLKSLAELGLVTVDDDKLVLTEAANLAIGSPE